MRIITDTWKTPARIASVSWYDVLARALNCLCVKEVLVKTGRRPYIIVSWVHCGRPPWEPINPGQRWLNLPPGSPLFTLPASYTRFVIAPVSHVFVFVLYLWLNSCLSLTCLIPAELDLLDLFTCLFPNQGLESLKGLEAIDNIWNLFGIQNFLPSLLFKN